MEAEPKRKALILSTHNTFYKGWIRPNNDKEGTYKVTIDTDIHPYVKGDKAVPVKDAFYEETQEERFASHG